jgi:hypothetical protein
MWVRAEEHASCPAQIDAESARCERAARFNFVRELQI